MTTEPSGARGAFRRRIRIESTDADTVVADLEDDFHRFRVTLRHDGSEVLGVVGDAWRFPWETCPGAVEPLRELRGAPLAPRATALADHADPHRNCTHLFDLAGLAISHAAAGRERRDYHVVVPERDERMRTSARVVRDGELVLEWELEGARIVAPDPFSELPLRGGFLRWADDHLDPDTAEAAGVLRRACDISWGRQHDWDSYERASEVGDFMLGVCHTFQPGTAEVALRVRGTTRDFSHSPDALLTE